VKRLTKVQKDNAKIAEAMKARKALKAPNDQVEKAAETFRKEVAAEKKPKPTRADLMECARQKGIKYFRILNRKELEDILALHGIGAQPGNSVVMNEIIEKAKNRWKSGWDRKKNITTGTV
jgi:hypothetical protein